MFNSKLTLANNYTFINTLFKQSKGTSLTFINTMKNSQGTSQTLINSQLNRAS
jgi:hypothetical protein